MPKQQEGVTDRLVSTIQIIQRSHGTGVLTVRRGKGATQEEGVLFFARGQVTEARVGNHKGSRAFNLLSTWENCAFLFVFSDERDRPLPFVSPPSPSSGSGPLPVTSAPPPDSKTFSAAASPLQRAEQELSPGGFSLTAIPHLRGQAAEVLRIFDRTHLSRHHRQICLLVNGQRNVADMMRLSGRSHAEICKLLRDLERASLLWIQDEPAQ